MTNWIKVFEGELEYCRSVDWEHGTADDIERLHKVFGKLALWQGQYVPPRGARILKDPEAIAEMNLGTVVNSLLAWLAVRHGLRFADLQEQTKRRYNPLDAPDWFQLAVAMIPRSSRETLLSDNARLILKVLRSKVGIRWTTKEVLRKSPMNERYVRDALKELKSRGFVDRDGQIGPWFLAENETS